MTRGYSRTRRKTYEDLLLREFELSDVTTPQAIVPLQSPVDYDIWAKVPSDTMKRSVSSVSMSKYPNKSSLPSSSKVN